MDEYVLISKSALADIANKVRSISGSNNTMNALEIDSNLGAQVNSVKETLTNYLTYNGKTVDENMNLKQLSNMVETVEGENLDAEVSAQAEIISEQDSKIAQLAEILDGKASGTSVETYTGIVHGAPEGILGSYPESVYIYTDETLTTRAVAPIKGGSEVITVVAGTSIVVYRDDDLGSYTEDELMNILELNPNRAGFFDGLYTPISEGFELN